MTLTTLLRTLRSPKRLPLQRSPQAALRIYALRMLVLLAFALALGGILLLLGWSKQATPIVVTIVVVGQTVVIVLLVIPPRADPDVADDPTLVGFAFGSPLTSLPWERLSDHDKLALLAQRVAVLEALVRSLRRTHDTDERS